MNGADPLTPFAHWGWIPPYEVGSEYAFPAVVLPVRAKSGQGMATGGGGGRTHLIRRAAAVLEPGGRLRYGAVWMCASSYDGATGVMLVPAVPDPDVCEGCREARIGPCVYRCFDPAGQLLYVGSTGALNKRRASHSQRSSWWVDVAEVTAEPYPALAAARRAESAAIRSEAPIHNKRGRSVTLSAA